MKVKCINEESGLILDKIYQVVIIHSEGYELKGHLDKYNPNDFEIVSEVQNAVLYNSIWIQPLNDTEHLFLKSLLPHTILHFNEEYMEIKLQSDFEQSDEFDPEYNIPIYSYLASETLNQKIIKTYHYQINDSIFLQTDVDYDLVPYNTEVNVKRAIVG
jgi:hypothetical protein